MPFWLLWKQALCNVYINVNSFNGRDLTMSAHKTTIYIVYYNIQFTKTQLANLLPNRLNNISLVPLLVSFCVVLSKQVPLFRLQYITNFLSIEKSQFILKTKHLSSIHLTFIKQIAAFYNFPSDARSLFFWGSLHCNICFAWEFGLRHKLITSSYLFSSYHNRGRFRAKK